MTDMAKKQQIHAELRRVFEACNTFDGWVIGLEKLNADHGLSLDMHEIKLACGSDTKGNVYEYCKKLVNNALK